MVQRKVDFPEIMTSGEWWKYWNSSGSIRNESETVAFEHLREIFPASWVIEEFRSYGFDTVKQAAPIANVYGFQALSYSLHPLLFQMLRQDEYGFKILVQLGLDLVLLKANACAGDLPRRLKMTDEYHGALAEVRIFAEFIRSGWTLQKNHKTGNKKCEFRASKDKEYFFCEVTRTREHEQNLNGSLGVSHGTLKYMAGVTNVPPQPYVYDLEIESAKHTGDKGTIMRKAQQLPEEGAGLLIIFRTIPLMDEFLRRIQTFLSSEGSRLKSVSEIWFIVSLR